MGSALKWRQIVVDDDIISVCTIDNVQDVNCYNLF